jgi:putative flippase GtrA
MSTAVRRVHLKVVHLWNLVLKEAAKFGVIGALAFVIDNGTYAFLQYGWFGPAQGPLHGHIKISTVLATAVATLFAWVGSRYWTFRDKRTTNPRRELLQFGFFNVIGALITLVCVMFAVDVLHLRGLGWESLARNFGIVLGTIFRFWAYRKFVFRSELVGELPAEPAELQDLTDQTDDPAEGIGDDSAQDDELLRKIA